MRHPFSSIRFLFGLLLAMACTPPEPQVDHSCKSDDQCIAGSVCVDGVCRAGSPQDAGACGDLNEPCCGMGICTNGLFCVNSVCIHPAATDVGHACQSGADCSGALCIDVGNGQHACSGPCASQTDCVAGWTCTFLSGGSGGVCQCTVSEEICDGKDNDCNGQVDDGPAPNAKCEQTTGPGSTCQSGSCVCPHRCDGVCVDPQTDMANCGTCGNACATGAVCNAGECACTEGLLACGDACSDTNTDNANCGTCGMACGEGTHCEAGECVCPDNQLLCGSNCAEIQNDPQNCGDCGTVCAAGASCVAGQCTCPTDQLACDGVCIAQNIGNCGGCGVACPVAHDFPVCSERQCLVRACESGYSDCNNSVTDGCEVDIRNDAQNCGGCLNVCLGGTICQNSTCICPSGTTLCNGTCVDLAADTHNCGSCGLTCSVGASCLGGGCHCPDGQLDCGGRCVDAASDTTNCGACGTTCDQGGSCVQGQCTCPTGTISCDGRCTPDQDDVTNCGGCHSTCPTNHSTASCSAGECGVAACAQGYDNCNATATDGCETNLLSDRNNCGSCQNACPAVTSCVSGQCKCPGTRSLCGASCVDLTSDGSNCGACGNGCPTGGACSGGQCRCATGSLVCNGACTPVQSDVNNCGACGNVCPSGASCVSGQCACPAGKFACHGACISSDLTNCGSCDNACTAENGTPACVSRTCTVASCQQGFADCDHLANDGCEVNTTNDAANCGGCNLACSTNHVLNSACTASQCGGTCADGFANCNGNLQSDGCESDLDSDVNNCGGCGIKCSGPNIGAAQCIGGVCTGICVDGYGDCNTLTGDGCEVNLKTDPNNCGGCANICSAQHMSTRTCTAAVCSGTCQTGFADCNANLLTDGCEVSTQNDLANCGGCNQACSGANVVNSACSSGQCAGTCATGFANCDNNLRSNGCERNIASDSSNCGGCNVTCSGANMVGAACTSGVCTGQCADGYTDCDNNLQLNGCEKHTAVDAANCGGCGVKCSTNHVTGSTCSNGTCTGSCAPGYADCNGNMQADGCETYVAGDAANCGACGTVCSGGNMATSTCSNGSCAGTCLYGYTDCNGNLQADGCEVDIAEDANNCGGCGTACNGANVTDSLCVNGSCTGSCSGGHADCDHDLRSDGCEVDITSDLANCGGCDATCVMLNVANPACTSGSCTGTCQNGFADCDNNLRTNGCETSLLSNPNNCGGCGVKCSGASVVSSLCSQGTCTGTCKSGYADCDANLQLNGCEVNTLTDMNNCGGCGTVCSANHVSNRSCSSGLCGGTCFTGYADCNGDKQGDGCEISLFSDPDNCGTCGRICPTGAHMARTCANPGTCGGTCDDGFADCDNNKATNGCEADLSSPDSCGTCTNLCSNNHMASRTCSSGTCGGSCATGYADCNGNKGTDGCETSIYGNTANCGGCGIVCSSNHVSLLSCSAAGVCNSACATGYADCNNNKQVDDCETPITGASALSNCGGCGIVCSTNHITAACSSGGVCNGTCAGGYADCNGNKQTDGCEISIASDTSNCGACGTICSTNHVNNTACSSGSCTGSCVSGYLNCNNNLQLDGCEIDSTTNKNNCGACGTICSTNHVSGTACVASQCTGTCNSGYKDCNNNLQTDGCETYSDGDTSNCGACGHVCPSSAPYCSAGSCYCPSGYLVCNGSCIAQSTSNCGSCGTTCSSNHIAPTCSGGTCGGTCTSGWGDCNSDKGSDGCETDLTTTSNCGACGNVCAAGQICSSGQCAPPPGQAEYTTPGTYSWTAPAGVFSVSVVVIGGGGGGAAVYGPGGGGGALAWGNSIPVTPGQSYTVVVGRGGDGGFIGHTILAGGPGNNELNNSAWQQGQPGTMSYFMSSAAIYAEGGGGDSKYNVHAAGGGTYWDGGGTGGTANTFQNRIAEGPGGGGVGDKGGTAGGGGGRSTNNGSGGGAGGYTANGGNGTTGAFSLQVGSGGSGGADGTQGWAVGGSGGLFGGGGGAGSVGAYDADGADGAGGDGADGAVRIIWGLNRAYPNTNTQDM